MVSQTPSRAHGPTRSRPRRPDSSRNVKTDPAYPLTVHTPPSGDPARTARHCHEAHPSSHARAALADHGCRALQLTSALWFSMA